MQPSMLLRARSGGATSNAAPRPLAFVEKLLTTGEVATLTGLSQSYFEKGRIYGYGPNFIRLRPESRSGAIRYRPDDVRRWLNQRECCPEGAGDA